MKKELTINKAYFYYQCGKYIGEPEHNAYHVVSAMLDIALCQMTDAQLKEFVDAVHIHFKYQNKY